MRAVSAAAAAAAVVQHAPKRHGQPCRQQRQHGPFQPAHASDDQQQELIQPRRNAPCYNALEHRNDCAAQPAAQPASVSAAPAEPVAAEAVTTKGAEPVPAAVMETVEENTFAPAETPEEAAEAAAEPAILLPDNYIEDAQAGVTVVEEIPSDADTAAADAATDAADNDKPTA